MTRPYPSEPAAERALLGSVLVDPRVLDECDLGPEGFYEPRHARLWRLLRSRHLAGEGIDLVLVAAEIGAAGAEYGGTPYVLGLADEAAPAATPHYARLVREAAQRRVLLARAEELLRAAHDEPIDDLRARASAVQSALDDGSGDPWQPIGAGVWDVVTEIERRAEPGASAGVSTGIRELDSLLGGLQAGRLYVVGARPAMGKSSLAQQIAESVASAGGAVGIWSQEMPVRELVERSLVRRSGVSGRSLRDGRLNADDWDRVVAAGGALEALEVYVDDRPARRIADIVGEARRLARRGRLGLLVVDYLQLMRLDRERGESTATALAGVSGTLKSLARELEVPVMALSQLNRECERRQDRRPILADLRDSGGLEQDADAVILLYREEVYDAATARRGICEVNVAKNRSGPTGTIDVTFRPEVMRWG